MMKRSLPDPVVLLVFILFAGLSLRLMLFNLLKIHGDAGVFIYDALVYFQGQTPFVDFATRSPLFHYIAAVPLAVGFSQIVTVRMFMIIVNLLVGLSVYKLTSQLMDWKSGVAAAAVFLLTTYMIVWGLFFKTQLLAVLFVLLGLIVFVPYLDAKEIPNRYAAALGIAIGAAFLIRRIAIANLGAVVLFILYYRIRVLEYSVRDVWRTAVTIIGCAVLSVDFAYIIMSNYSVSGMVYITDEHLLSLFFGVEATSLGSATPTGLERVALRILGPEYGLANAWNLMVVVAVALPAVFGFFVYISELPVGADRQSYRWMLPGAVSIGIIGWAWTLLGQYPTASVVLIATLGITGIWFIETVSTSSLAQANATLLLPTFLLVGTAGAYLYKGGGISTVYYMDFFPYASILSGLGFVALADALPCGTKRRVGIGILVLAVCTSFLFANPVIPLSKHIGIHSGDQVGNNKAEFTPQSVVGVQSLGDNIESKTDEGDLIFSAHALYIAEAERRLVADLSRNQYFFTGRWSDLDRKIL